jgi:hypothetical protein
MSARYTYARIAFHGKERDMSLRVACATALALALVASTESAASTSSKPSPPAWVLQGAYVPTIDPTNFVRVVDNEYFPLARGTKFHFEGVSDGTPQTDDVVVTTRIRVVLGVRCTVVRDTVAEDGKAVERTFDWYAQDRQGNVTTAPVVRSTRRVWWERHRPFECRMGRSGARS